MKARLAVAAVMVGAATTGLSAGPARSTGSAPEGRAARLPERHSPASPAGVWQGDSWNQWRGPSRDGISNIPLPADLPSRLDEVWSVEVGSGYSSPVVADDRVYIHGREGEEEVVRALRLADGGLAWRFDYPAPYRVNMAARAHGPGPKSTPAVVSGRLFTFGIDGMLTALAADGGELLWQRGFVRSYESTSPVYGAAMSPLVAGEMVVAHVGGRADGALVAFDVATGAERWSWSGDGPGYASPILVEVAGREQIVTQSQRQIVAVDPESGRPLWSLPFETPFDQNIVTPVLAGELLVFSGLDTSVFAVALRGSGESMTPTEVWRDDSLPLYMNTPVVVAGRLIGLSHRNSGQFFALDPATGTEIWRSEGRQGDNAALVVAGDRVLALLDAGALIVLDAGADEFRPLARYEVADSPTWAHPVPTRRGILVRDASTLALWSF